MDSVSTTLTPRSTRPGPAVSATGAPPLPTADDLPEGDGDPPSSGPAPSLIASLSEPNPLGEGIGLLGGIAIAFLTLVVPLTSVVLDRSDQPNGDLLPALPTASARDEPPQPARIPRPRTSESLGGNSGRQP